jgi:caffeoyl-CoA O-methyltransferase
MSKMIPDLEGAFRQFVPPRDAVLSELEQEARREGIPIIGPVVGQFLHILARAMQAKQILELGTATGYSAIYLARACEGLKGKVVTLERDEGMANRARANFKKVGLEHRIEIRVADAMAEMTNMKGPFDLIFLDIDKEGYLPLLSHCHRLLKTGGLMVTDNVGFHAANDFNRAVFESPQWKSVHLLSFLPYHSPEKDGLCLALRT